MANQDTPHGLTFAYTLHGGPPTVQYMPCGSCTEIFRGDIAITTTTGVMPKTTGSDWDPVGATAEVVGVSNGYSPSGSQTNIPIYTDLRNTVFKVQVSTTTVTFKSSDEFQIYDTTWSAGSTATGMSAAEMNGTTGTGRFGLRKIGYVNDPNFSTSGGWQEVYVTLAVPGMGMYSAYAATSDAG